MHYWKECIAEAFDDAGITADELQISIVAEWVEGAHDNYGMAHGHECIPHPSKLEAAMLRTELEKERGKSVCPDCKGTGENITYGPVHCGVSQCFRCKGEGKC